MYDAIQTDRDTTVLMANVLRTPGGQRRERMMGNQERRNLPERAALVQRVITGVLENPSVTLSIETLQAWLDIRVDAAQRILARLVSSGLVREVQKGVFVRGTWPGVQPLWY